MTLIFMLDKLKVFIENDKKTIFPDFHHNTNCNDIFNRICRKMKHEITCLINMATINEVNHKFQNFSLAFEKTTIHNMHY